MGLSLSRRGLSIPASPIRKLVPFADEAKSRGTKVYHLNIGQPDIATPEEMWERIKNYDEKVLAYGPSNGLLEFRQGLCGYYARYGVNVSPAEIIVTTGGSEALLFAMLATCDAGDEVLVPEPFYANYNGFAVYGDIKMVPVTAQAEDGFRLPDKARFVEKVTPHTKAILLSNPGNPTGVVYTRAELITVAELAREYNLYIIADEVYREFVYDGERYTSIMSLPGIDQHAVIADSISKRFSACGARVGNVVSKNRQLMDSIMKFAQARLCPPTLEQVGAIGALSVPDSYFTGVLSEYQERRDIVYNGIMQIKGALCRPPKGAFYVIAKLPIDDGDAFAEWMLRSFSLDGATTMVAPAAGFYATPGLGRDEVRLAYVLNATELRHALQVLAAGVKEYQATVMR
ncbi:MAG: Aspartate aminotransferase [Firmicutes bacterium]|nr:Aspartate aminotransferase [candidate division NPL-UPA2 bacterium]